MLYRLLHLKIFSATQRVQVLLITHFVGYKLISWGRLTLNNIKNVISWNYIFCFARHF